MSRSVRARFYVEVKRAGGVKNYRWVPRLLSSQPEPKMENILHLVAFEDLESAGLVELTRRSKRDISKVELLEANLSTNDLVEKSRKDRCTCAQIALYLALDPALKLHHTIVTGRYLELVHSPALLDNLEEIYPDLTDTGVASKKMLDDLVYDLKYTPC